MCAVCSRRCSNALNAGTEPRFMRVQLAGVSPPGRYLQRVGRCGHDLSAAEGGVIAVPADIYWCRLTRWARPGATGESWWRGATCFRVDRPGPRRYRQDPLLPRHCSVCHRSARKWGRAAYRLGNSRRSRLPGVLWLLGFRFFLRPSSPIRPSGFCSCPFMSVSHWPLFTS